MATIIEQLYSTLHEALFASTPETKSVNSGVLVPASTGAFGSLKTKPRDWTTEKGIRDGYDSNEWVKICVDRIATPAASVPWRVSRFTSMDAKKRFSAELKSIPAHEKSTFIDTYKTHYLEPEADHPLEKLIEEPNSFLDRQTMVERITQHLLLGGNSIITKVRTPQRGRGTGGLPLELWVQPPDVFNPVADRAKFIRYYEMTVPDSQKPLTIQNQDLIHFMLPDPSNLYWGSSVLKAGAMTIDTDVEAIAWQKQSLENRAAPDGVFAINSEISEQEFEVMRTQMRTQYMGRDNARTPLLIGNNAKFYQLSLSPVEMDFIQTRRMNREAICAIFGVDPRIAGATDPAQGTAIKEVMRAHWLSLILPYMDKLQSGFNRSLAREWGPDYYIWYDTMNIDALQENFHEKARSLALLARQGISVQALNRRLRMGFTEEELVGLDVGMLPASTRSILEIRSGENQPELTGGAGGGDDEGEVVDGQIVEEPIGELPPGGDDLQDDQDKSMRLRARRTLKGWEDEMREEVKSNGD